MGFTIYRRTSVGKWKNNQTGTELATTTPPPPANSETRPSGIWGAGFQNAGDIHPTNPNLWLTGGDVAGIHLSDDAGMSWMPNNTGIDSSDKARITGIKWSEDPATPNIAYAFSAGWNGSVRNYFMRGEYDPSLGVIVRWNVVVQVDGGWASAQNGTQTGDTLASGTSGHPRQSKNKMIALDESQGLAYVGSADGMWRLNLDGTGTPTRVWGAGQSITAIQLDPLNKNIAYVTVDLGSLTGVHRLTTIRTGTAPTVASYRDAGVLYSQSCKAVVVGGVTRLVVATGKASRTSSPTNSVVYWPGGTFTTGWVDISSDINADESGANARWSGLDAVLLSNGQLRILVTNSYDQTGATGKKVKITDWNMTGVPTWTFPATDTQYRVGNTSGPTWWLSNEDVSLMMDRGGFDSVSPCIAPSNHNVMMIGGRSGVWRKESATTSFHPAVRGLAVTTSWMPLVSNQNSQNMAVADVDWTVLRSITGFDTQPMHPVGPTNAVAWNITQSPAGHVILCTGQRDNNYQGGIYRSDNCWLTDSGNWIDEMGTGTRPGGIWADNNNRPQVKGGAITFNGGTQILLAAVRSAAYTFNGGTLNNTASNTGLWRKVGAGASGTWTRISLPGIALPFNTTNKQLRQHFAVAPNSSGTIWMNDPLSGLWKSTDYGATWGSGPVWAHTTSNIYSSHIVADPTRTNIYYALTGGTQAWRIDSSNNTRTALNAGAFNPAGVAVHPASGNIYLAETATARLWKSTDGGTTWLDITTASWEAMCATVKGISLGSNGKLVTAMYSGYAITDVN